jgi:hypothetical protein
MISKFIFTIGGNYTYSPQSIRQFVTLSVIFLFPRAYI